MSLPSVVDQRWNYLDFDRESRFNTTGYYRVLWTYVLWWRLTIKELSGEPTVTEQEVECEP